MIALEKDMEWHNHEYDLCVKFKVNIDCDKKINTKFLRKDNSL